MSQNFEAIKTAAKVHMAEVKVPGMALGIIHDGTVEMGGIGITNVNNPQPVTEDTIFYIGSATKPFTATVVLKMVERGEVDLQAPVRQYLPDFQVQDMEASEKSRVIDLFQHRTGWRGDYFDEPSSGEDALEKAVLAFRFLPQRTPYGELWAYNNVNYIIAGRLIQVVSRAKSYEQVVKAELLDSLGMSRSSFFVNQLITERLACGHTGVYDGKSEPKATVTPAPRPAFPLGGLLSCVSDMMKWIQFQLDGKDKNGNQLLSVDLLKQAHSPLVEGELDEYTGIAWFVEEVGGLWTVFHAGRVPGNTCKTLFIPEKNFGMVVLTNNDRGAEVYDAIVAHALKLYFGVERKPVAVVAAPRAELEPFVGTWVGDLEDYRFYFEGEQLKTQRLIKPLALGMPVSFENPPALSVGSAGKDRCIMTDGVYVGMVGQIRRDKKGQPKFLSMQHRIFILEE